MRRFYTGVVKHCHSILIFFLIALVICTVLQSQVAVNYDITDYLPDNTSSTRALKVMEQEFDGGIPNARVMIPNVTIPQALEYKRQISQVDGVADVTWLDDTTDTQTPLSNLDQAQLDSYYKDNNALFTVTIEEGSRISAVNDIRAIIGDQGAMTGSAVSTAVATTETISEIHIIATIAVLFVFLVLIVTMRSWLEPVLVLAGLGVAIMINNGTNLIFGEISFVTNAAGSILQLAVSLDYSVFLLHRFEECLQEHPDPEQAMVDALCKSTSSISSSGLTTVIGFLALALMRFRLGPDLGLALAKGVAISLVTVFLFMPGLILTFRKLLQRLRHRKFLPDFHGFGRFVQHFSRPMVVVFVILIVPAFLASNSNQYSYGASDIFGPGTQLGDDTALIEDRFGQSDTYVLLVPKGDTAKQTALSQELNRLDHVTGILSFVDLAGAEIPSAYLAEDQLRLLESKNYSRMVLSVDVPYEGEHTFALVENIRNVAQNYYPDAYYLAGQGVSTYDLKDTVTADMMKVNLIAIAAVFLVLIVTMREILLPVILVLCIETAIWLNLSVSYFCGATIFYIAYLIISSIQLGATVDYAILLTDRYRENRQRLPKKEAAAETVSDVFVSVFTSGIVLTVVGLLLGYISTNELLALLGIFIGRGAIFSLAIVLLVLPGLLQLFDRVFIRKPKTLSHRR